MLEFTFAKFAELDQRSITQYHFGAIDKIKQSFRFRIDASAGITSNEPTNGLVRIAEDRQI